jgi:hypothetical protein
MAFGIMIALGSVGLLHLAASTVNQETASLAEGRAFYAAESGLLMGAKWMENQQNCDNIDMWPPDEYAEFDIIPGFSLNGFDVQVDIIRENYETFIVSKALSSSVIGYNKVVSQLTDPGGGSSFDTAAFDYGIFTDSELAFNGTSDTRGPGGTSALIHANGNVELKGNSFGIMDITSHTHIRLIGNASVQGTGKAPGLTGSSSKFSGGFTYGAVPIVNFPDIDLTPWFQVAQANGEVHNGFNSSNDYTPNGGILWVNGNVHLSGGTFTGQIIATGDVRVSAGVVIVGPDTGFAIASQGSLVKFTGQSNIRGLIYVKNGEFDQKGGSTMEGQVIAKEKIVMGGNSDALLYRKTIPITPGGAAQACPNLIAGSWRERNEGN